jgi:hypothetical protein
MITDKEDYEGPSTFLSARTTTVPATRIGAVIPEHLVNALLDENTPEEEKRSIRENLGIITDKPKTAGKKKIPTDWDYILCVLRRSPGLTTNELAEATHQTLGHTIKSMIARLTRIKTLPYGIRKVIETRKTKGGHNKPCACFYPPRTTCGDEQGI